MTVITSEKDMGLLNENGKNLLELKKVLLQNKENPLIHNGLLSSINESDYEKTIYKKLINANVTAETFESTLVSNKKFINAKIFKKLFTKYQTKLSTALEKKGHRYFTTDISPKDGSVLVIRKFGINLEFIKREFRIKDEEARLLLKEGFVENYARLKLNSIVKDLVEDTEKKLELSTAIMVETSDFYYNEAHEIYNIDFRIAVFPTEKHLNGLTYSYENTSLIKEIDDILLFIQKEYYRILNITKE